MGDRSRKRPGVVLLVGLVVTILVAVGAIAFQPWRLFIDTRIDEAAPAAPVGPAAPVVPTASTRPKPAAAPTTSTKAPTNKAPATKTPAPKSEIVRSGQLISHEHPTSGDVRIIQQPDGSRVLRIDDLKTTNGPDLRVRLSGAPVREGRAGWFVFKDFDHLELGKLKANQGNQNYPLPASAELDEFASVTIWCKRFAVSFGAAELTAS